MTIVIWFHASKYRTFKDYYLYCVQGVSYSRFISLMKRVCFPLFAFQKTLEKNTRGIAFIDSTILSVCHICRSSSHRVFKKIAAKGKNSTGWFFGMKLHLVVNTKGEIISWMITSGNVSDITPVPRLCENLFGKLFGDKGYISSRLFQSLYEQGVQLVTRLRSNMKNMLMDVWDKIILYKRSLVESVIHQLQLGCQIEHHRHRCPINFFINLVSGLISYSLNETNPSIRDLSYHL